VTKVLICGNGGLAAEAEHFAAELMGKFHKDVYIPCIALTSNTSLLTALANDIGFENVFAHQVEVLGEPGDLLIGLTTTASKNVLQAIKAAKAKGMATILWDGKALKGEGVAAKQEFALSALHNLAREMKDACC